MGSDSIFKNTLRGGSLGFLFSNLKGGVCMKIYIAGKISGDNMFKEKFEKTKIHFETLGYIVLNPAELPGGMTQGDYMRICLAMVDSADIVYFHPDHMDSKGSQIELLYARYIGKEIRHDTRQWQQTRI